MLYFVVQIPRRNNRQAFSVIARIVEAGSKKEAIKKGRCTNDKVYLHPTAHICEETALGTELQF